MNRWGSGRSSVEGVHLDVGPEPAELVSGFPGSLPKYTEATTDFSSISMPALAAACLTMAWVFWRTG